MSLLKRLFKAQFKSHEKAEKADKSDKSSYYPEKKLPADENFMVNFRNNGGKFIYCENWDEVSEAFDNILLENDWYERNVLCFNPQLHKRFDGYNLNFTDEEQSSFFLSTCESLVGHTGAIMFSSNQIREKKMPELPHHMVILATTSQIVDTISEGMRVLNNQRLGKTAPTNITTLQYFDGVQKKDFMNYGSNVKNLYLLLLEDL